MLGALRRAASSQLPRVPAATRSMGGGLPGGYFGEGTQTGRNGYLFGEAPLPPGQSRKWESWEAIWYTTLGAAVVMLGVGLHAKPDTSALNWAKREAQKQLDAK